MILQVIAVLNYTLGPGSLGVANFLSSEGWRDGDPQFDPNRMGKIYHRDENGNWHWNNGYKREDGSFDPAWDNPVDEETNKVLEDARKRAEQRLGDFNLNGKPDILESKPDPKTKTWWDRAKDFVQSRDPLTFDLDGDGLETTGITSTTLFDHDGDGIKNGSGWVKPDDAFLVLDKNGNGSIDNGRELFGDSTIKSNGQLAADGFDALADLDTNHDGVVNNSDAQFNSLRLWRDLNQYKQ